MGREGRDYWEEQLSEYWDSGLTIQEYSELKELPYESTRRWIRVLEKARQHVAANEYRNTEIHGNAYRHPEKYQCLTEQRICAPFIRPDYRN